MSVTYTPLVIRLLPKPLRWRIGRRYWAKHQCPAHQVNTGLCCVRRHHTDPWHQDGRGDHWLW